MCDAHIPFTHPTNKYKKWVKDHAANDFQACRDKANGDEKTY